MDEAQYLHRVDAVFRRILDALESVDPDDAEGYASGDVLTITFRGGARCVINTQRSTRQIWLAAGARAWHFGVDPATDQWMDDKNRGDELFATVSRAIREGSGITVTV